MLDLKSENKRLEEENAGWELLMRDQTMSGNVKGRGMFSEDWLDEGELTEEEDGKEDEGAKVGSQTVREGQERDAGRKGKGRGRTVLESLDEEMEMGLEGQGEEGMQSLGSGGDLAAELGRANDHGAAGASVADTEAAQEAKRSEADGECLDFPAWRKRRAARVLTGYSASCRDQDSQGCQQGSLSILLEGAWSFSVPLICHASSVFTASEDMLGSSGKLIQ